MKISQTYHRLPCIHIIISVPNISSTEDITNLLQDLDANKSPGPDGIPAAILKACASEIAPFLQVIFTQSLTTNCIPDDWLSANVVPISKKGDRSSPSNYRPISLTLICCKLMEYNGSPYSTSDLMWAAVWIQTRTFMWNLTNQHGRGRSESTWPAEKGRPDYAQVPKSIWHSPLSKIAM